MNVIEKTREILQSFPKIAEVCDSIHVDFADAEPTSYGLSSLGDTKLSEDILGNERRQHTFMLYTTYGALNDYERLSNSGTLLELAQWLGRQGGIPVEHEICGEKYAGEITEISTENGMLYSVPQENTADGVQYQLQIIVKYTIEI